MLALVREGTDAGRKMHRRSVPKLPWQCRRGHMNKPYAATCLAAGCREKRPKEQ